MAENIGDSGFFRHTAERFLKGKTGNIWIQIFRYLFSGGVAFIVDYSVLYALTEWGGLHYLLSSSISFMLGLTVTYIFSILWIFDVRSREKKWEEFLIFAAIGLVGLALTELFMYLFTSVFGFHYLISKIITTILVTIWNFSAKKLLLFSKRGVRNDHKLTDKIKRFLKLLIPGRTAVTASLDACRMHRIARKVLLSLLIFILILTGIAILLEASPIYRFSESTPFEGPYIYNPYEDLDTSLGWSRTNLHTHTHATRWINECELYPDSVLTFYDRYGYDIVTFSNHMELTEYPGDAQRQVRVYEHGYNPFKFHKLVFAPDRVRYYDIPFPVMPSQKQFMMDILSENSDFVFYNHPDRTFFTDRIDMERVSGYRLLEADCGFSYEDTFSDKWDIALSAGHYVLSAISDDLHKPRLTNKIARRCSFLNTPSYRYEDIKATLLKGCFYTMHLPDFGDGDLRVKERKNAHLAGITDIGLKHDTIFMTLSRPASRIEIIGQGGRLINTIRDTCTVEYRMKADDSYIRLTARFADSTVIFTNPFARWDGYTISGTPYADAPHPVDIPRTVLYNLMLLAGAFLCWRGIRALMHH